MAVTVRTYGTVALLGTTSVLRAAVGQEVDDSLPIDAFVGTEASGQYTLVEPSILDEAVVLLRSSTAVADGWTSADDWRNEGTGGATFDASVGDITPVLSGGKFRVQSGTDVTCLDSRSRTATSGTRRSGPTASPSLTTGSLSTPPTRRRTGTTMESTWQPLGTGT